MFIEIPYLGVAVNGVDLAPVHDGGVRDLKDAIIGEMVNGHLSGDGVQDDCDCRLANVSYVSCLLWAGQAEGDVSMVGADSQRPMESVAYEIREAIESLKVR